MKFHDSFKRTNIKEKELKIGVSPTKIHPKRQEKFEENLRILRKSICEEMDLYDEIKLKDNEKFQKLYEYKCISNRFTLHNAYYKAYEPIYYAMSLLHSIGTKINNTH